MEASVDRCWMYTMPPQLADNEFTDVRQHSDDLVRAPTKRTNLQRPGPSPPGPQALLR